MPDTIVISSTRTRFFPNFRELWAYRDLVRTLALRDVRVRYSQTLLGMAWAVLQPVTAAIIFTVVFGIFARLPTDGVPYPVFALSALVLWQFFQTTLTQSTNSVVNASNLIRKVYFPRLAIPLAAAGVPLVDYAVSLGVLTVVATVYGYPPRLAWLGLPLVGLGMLVTAVGAGALASALSARYRDIKHVMPFFVQLLMYASPVAYGLNIVPETYRPYLALNPLVGLLEAHRALIIGTPLNWVALGVSCAAGLMLLGLGVYTFDRLADTMADTV